MNTDPVRCYVVHFVAKLNIPVLKSAAYAGYNYGLFTWNPTAETLHYIFFFSPAIWLQRPALVIYFYFIFIFFTWNPAAETPHYVFFVCLFFSREIRLQRPCTMLLFFTWNPAAVTLHTGLLFCCFVFVFTWNPAAETLHYGLFTWNSAAEIPHYAK